MSFRRRLAALGCSLVSLSLPTLLGAQQPAFRAGVELVRLDVTVVADDGTPVPNLTPSDFEVAIAGASRRVVSAQFVSSTAADAMAAAPEPGGFSSNTDPGGRLFLVVVDEMNLVQNTTD